MVAEEAETFDLDILSRLQSILIERYIHTPRNKELWSWMLDLTLQVDHESPKPKVMGCLLTGRPHSGKTTAVRQFKQAYLVNMKNAREKDIILFQIPSRARLKGMMVRLAQQLDIPDIPENPRDSYPTYILVEKVAKKLWNDYTKLVIIDEFQRLFELSGESRVEILSGFNDLVNESQVPIVLVGVEGVDKILDLENYEDESNLKGTFCSRFPEFKLKPWKDPDEIEFIEFVYTIYDGCQFGPSGKKEAFLDDIRVRKRIIDMTEGLTGKIIHLIKWTARHMIRKRVSGQMTLELLEDTFRQIQAKGW